ncbi:protein PSK SIMULATOR 1-like [Bidens hawaiensis]|uniref:protein PSK SIMULATOR 1-like n=1 Tax=Bidens hawaiensis TaxID=980011 RepID=UPI00404AADAA
MKDSPWFPNMLHKNKGVDPGSPMIGIFSFEASRLMSRLANLWHCLSDRQMSRLKEELRYSLGIRTLISDDHAYLINLALEEIVDTLKGVAASVSRFGKKCSDPVYHNLDRVFDNPFDIDLKWFGWEYRLKKMEKRVNKMKKFAAVMLQYYEELERLSDLESRLTKMQSNGVNQGQLHEFHQRVMWQREEVSGLRERSPYVRSFDYVVRLLVRSCFTIIERIKVVFGITTENRPLHVRDSPHGGCFVPKNSNSPLARASVYPSEGSFKRSVSNLGHRPVICGRYPSCRPHGLAQNDGFTRIKKGSFSFSSKQRLMIGQQPTLGNAALALRYANIIIFIETLVMSTRVISSEARDDLYNMLTTNLKQLLRQKLFLSKEESLLAYDERFASGRRSSVQRILDWLSPLAHNMIKWYSERNFEKQLMGSGGNVLLVQTLYYADLATSEITITELIVGLHYVSRFSQQLVDRSLMGSA